jgi:hypothetical protein
MHTKSDKRQSSAGKVSHKPAAFAHLRQFGLTLLATILLVLMLIITLAATSILQIEPAYAQVPVADSFVPSGSGLGRSIFRSYSQVLGDGPGVHTYPTLTGDVDGDGCMDLIFVLQAGEAGLEVRVKRSNCDGTWQEWSQVLGDGPGVHTYPALTGDVDGDGCTDLIFVVQAGDAGLQIRVKRSNCDGTWQEWSQMLGDASVIHTYPTLTGDVDGDGCTDLIFVGQDWSSAGLNIRVKRSNCDGTWQEWHQVLGDASVIHTYPTLTGDVDGDGCTDLIFVGHDWSSAGLNIRVKRSDCSGAWQEWHQVLGDASVIHTYPTLTGDVDGDGCTDLIFVGQDWSGAGLNVRVKRSNCDGTWQEWHQVLGDGLGVHTYPALTGDIDGDSCTDLIFVLQAGDAGLEVRVKRSDCDGAWQEWYQVLGDGPAVHTYPTLPGDVNGDRKTDLTFVGQDWSGPYLNIRTKIVSNTVYLPIVLNNHSPASPPTPTPTPGHTSSTRFANDTSYPIIYLTIDGMQYYQQSPQGIAPGHYHEIALTPGSHTYVVKNGWWESNTSRLEMYQWTGSFLQENGVVGTINFYDPTIRKLLANFGTSAYWQGDYWDELVPHTVGFCFRSNGTWNLDVDGAKRSNGAYTLVSRSPGTQSIQFTIGSYVGTLYELLGFFYMKNGPPDWPLIQYYRESTPCP